jgi:hypothetical protein
LAGDPSIVGITDVRDDRVVYRLTVPTLPGRRDEVRRAWRVLALDAFNDGELRAPPDHPTVAYLVAAPAPGESPAD